MGEHSEESDTPRLFVKIGIFFGKFLSILPVIASIVAPMALFFGGFIYFSYNFFLYPRLDIVNYYLGYGLFGDEFPSTGFHVILLVLEGAIFLLGLYIFIDALITMAFHKKHAADQPIVQNRLYKYVRHPQNLGILLMTIPFILYIPGTNDIGIRSGDVLSWILFYVLTTSLSIIEEKGMLKKNREKYFAYIQKTGFFTPLRLHKFKNYTEKDTKRYMIQSILKVTILTIIFVSVGIVAFFFGNSTLVKFPPPHVSWEYFFSEEYLQTLSLSECVPFLVFLSCVLGMGVYSLLNYIKKRKLAKKKFFSKGECESKKMGGRLDVF